MLDKNTISRALLFSIEWVILALALLGRQIGNNFFQTMVYLCLLHRAYALETAVWHQKYAYLAAYYFATLKKVPQMVYVYIVDIILQTD